MRQLAALGRGLAHRAGSAALIAAVAIVAAAAAAAGPVYYAAAQPSILASSISQASVIGRGYEATASGPFATTLPRLDRALAAERDADLGAATYRRAFSPPVESIEGSDVDPMLGDTFSLVWRTGTCAHLVITGRCPATAYQVLVSKSDAAVAGWHIGSEIEAQTGPSASALRVTGIYQVPTQSLAS